MMQSDHSSARWRHSGSAWVLTGLVLLLVGSGIFSRACAQAHAAEGPAGPPGEATSARTNENEKGFSIQVRNGRHWLIRPTGDPFFSLGVCCVNGGASPEDYDPENPGYAAWQHYQDAKEWGEVTLERLRAWGFTTVGAWSDFGVLSQCTESNLAFIPVLHIGSTAGAPWWDMWDSKITERMEQVAREQILALRNDPRVIGYYSDNEMGWWNATLFKMTLEQVPSSGQRQRLLLLLKETYRNDWSLLLKDFEAEAVESWEDLEQRGMLFLRPGGNGIQTMRKFLSLLADRYYFLVHDIIKKYDRRALIFGDRYQSFYYPEVVRAAAPYLDAVSSNLNAPWNDATFARFFLETLHGLSQKPVVIGEFYMAARQNRSGNQNDHGTYPVVEAQSDRAAGFQTTLQALLETPYVVGADWFQLYDEPSHGRGDGENFNFGFVDIQNRPYEEMTKASSTMNLFRLGSTRRGPRRNATSGVPRAPSNVFGKFRATTALKSWNREQGFIPPDSEFPLADLYICWDREMIYLGLYSQDIVEDAYYRSKVVPKNDRAEWSVLAGTARRPIRARIGAGMEAIVSDPKARVINLSGVNLNVRNIAGMELPAELFGQRRFRAGDTIELSSTLLTHCQAYRVSWTGRFTLLATR